MCPRTGSFRNGGFQVAVDGDCDGVPIAIVGTREMMPPGCEFELGFGSPIITVHPSISPADADFSPERLRDMTHAVIERTLEAHYQQQQQQQQGKEGEE